MPAMFFLIVALALAAAYVALMLRYLYGWRSLPGWRPPAGWIPAVRVSVVIPARDEAANITACLEAIAAGTYPAHLVEIIVVDDFSDDGTAALVVQLADQWKLAEKNRPHLRLLPLANSIRPGETVHSHKKKAIDTGIAHAGGELVVTTDADCIAPEGWLLLLASVFFAPGASKSGASGAEDSLLPNGVAILAAPVVFHREKNLLQRFQSLDFLGLMGITGAGIRLGSQRMGNGANLAYPKAVFEAVGGFEGNEYHASGDDMFLIQKVAARWPSGVFFLKNPAAAVCTEAKPDWRAFVQQRLRWGTKNAALPEWSVRLALLTVFLFCWSIWLNLTLALAGGENARHFAILFLLQLALKALADYLLLRDLCRFFDRKDLLKWFAPSFILHTLYIPLIGTASLFFKKYNWKGRQVQ